MSPEFRELLTRLTNDGYQCWLSESSQSGNPTYAYVVKDNRIGYVQCDRDVFTLSTVHKPNKQCGTGFRISEPLSMLECERAIDTSFQHVPGWASTNDRNAVVKYKSWDEFIKRDYCTRTLFRKEVG